VTLALGLNLIHDTSAAVLRDGMVIAAAEEERFNRQRHTSAFPDQAMRYCLAAAQASLDDVDYIATSFDFRRFRFNLHPSTRNTIDHDDASLRGQLKVAGSNFETYVRATHNLRSRFGDRVIAVPHHLAHAYTAYFFSGMPEANILTIDGRGENEATCLYHGLDGRIATLESYSIRHSLGHFYSYVTHLCGLYSQQGQEGKTMGLAPYGGPGIELAPVITFNDGRYRLNRPFMRRLTRYGTPLGRLNDHSRNLAWGAQDALNRAFIFLAQAARRRTGSRNFALAGGVALNATANGKLLQQDFVDDLFVYPAANDAGTAIGAALYALRQQRDVRPGAQDLVYLGPEFDDDFIAAELRQCMIAHRRCADVEQAAADRLAAGKVVGWYQGRMEFGPRALGNRSILADPRTAEMKDRINRSVKYREDWRPLAPAVLAERAQEYFVGARSAPYMIINFDVQPERRHEIPAVVHVDGTARVQSVGREDNPRFHRLISLFAERTGVPMLLNTSLNSRAQPIACTPRDAITTFYSSGLDALCLGSFLLEKNA
jgi:carbamoyltransferase